MNATNYMMNRWADSLSFKQWQRIFPEVGKVEMPYVWNKLSVEERTAIFKKWSNVFEDKAIISKTFICNGNSKHRTKKPRLVSLPTW